MARVAQGPVAVAWDQIACKQKQGPGKEEMQKKKNHNKKEKEKKKKKKKRGEEEEEEECTDRHGYCCDWPHGLRA